MIPSLVRLSLAGALVAARTLGRALAGEPPAAAAARRRLQAARDALHPAGGIPDTGDPSGRHSKNVERRAPKKTAPSTPQSSP